MNEVVEKTLVLNTVQIQQKIRRMAFEVYENNAKEKLLILAGIEGQGHAFAKILAKEIKAIAGIEVHVVKVSVDKLAETQSEVAIDATSSFKKKVVILVDDVLNSGRTLAYAMKPFLETGVKKMEVAVLVNRSHTLFPITPTYTGYELSTTLTDHVEVKLGKDASVHLL
ncbi:MAG: phosphoribosyltransferase [Chryseotalea sp. WA131a]|jgi:pyrimidine operon attenuation protein/uracil phosphoribosyltransferase|nr:MAG: phosphoribosyltransferase [Chryseotalea sp. WA131a]